MAMARYAHNSLPGKTNEHILCVYLNVSHREEVAVLGHLNFVGTKKLLCGSTIGAFTLLRGR